MILDTNALSAWADSQEELLEVLPGAGSVEIPVITVGEYLWGLRRSTERGRLESWLTSIISGTRLLTVGLATAEAYANVRHNLHAKGRPIPPNDTWIAALAIQYRLPILSRDAHFDYVDGVQRVSW